MRLTIARPEPFRASEIDEILDASGRGAVVLRGRPGSGKTRILGVLAEKLGAAVVRVPYGLDQVEATILGLASNLGAGASARTGRALHQDPSDLTGALNALEGELGKRPLLVDDYDVLLGRQGLWADLSQVNARAREQLAAWLRGHALVRTCRWGRDETFRLREPEQPPEQLLNGGAQDTQELWDLCDREPRQYHLSLVRAVLSGELPDIETSFALDDLVDGVFQLLPQPAANLLRWMSVHGRPLPAELIGSLSPGANPLRLLVALDLVDDTGGAWSVDRLLAKHVRARLSPTQKREDHLVLAREFSRGFELNDPSSWKRATWISEAHRHFTRGGDTERARAHLRFGVTLLLDIARGKSKYSKYHQAAELYESAIALNQRLREGESSEGIGKAAHAYSVHYAHYNRAKAGSESLETTCSGYRESVDLWPENGLFWSRLVLSHLYLGDRAQALSVLRQAYDAVPTHPERDWILTARTVARLLRRSEDSNVARRLEDALFVWDGLQPELLREQQVLTALLARLEEGWHATHLQADLELYFRRPIFLKVIQTGDTCTAIAPELGATCGGVSPAEAYASLVGEVHQRAATALATPSHTLSAADRLRKQTLMSAIDVVASGLAPSPDGLGWVFGQIRRDDRRLVLDAGQSVGNLVVPEHLQDEAVTSDTWWFGRVEIGLDGNPGQTLLELRATTEKDPEKLRTAWQRMSSSRG